MFLFPAVSLPLWYLMSQQDFNCWEFSRSIHQIFDCPRSPDRAGHTGGFTAPRAKPLPFQTVILAAQPQAMPGKPLLEPRGTTGIWASQLVWDAGRHLGMAGALLSPGRALQGQEMSVATCPTAPRTDFLLFFKSSNAETPTGILLCLVDCGVCLQGLSKMGYYSSKIIFW